MGLTSMLGAGLGDKFCHRSLFSSQSSDTLTLSGPVFLLEKTGSLLHYILSFIDSFCWLGTGDPPPKIMWFLFLLRRFAVQLFWLCLLSRFTPIGQFFWSSAVFSKEKRGREKSETEADFKGRHFSGRF